MTNYLAPDRRAELLAALAEDTAVNVARRLGVDLSTVYAWDSRRLRGVCVCDTPLHEGPCATYHDAELRAKILRARVEENVPRVELAAQFNVSLEVVTRATAGFPYRGRRSPPTHDWRPDELDKLRRLYPAASWPEILAALPGRPVLGLQRKASALGIRRTVARLPARQISPELARLRARRRQLGLTVKQVAERVGLRTGTMGRYEAGWDRPRPTRLAAWYAALGLTSPAAVTSKPASLPPKLVAVIASPLPPPIDVPQLPPAPTVPFSMFAGLPRSSHRGKTVRVELDYASGRYVPAP